MSKTVKKAMKRHAENAAKYGKHWSNSKPNGYAEVHADDTTEARRVVAALYMQIVDEELQMDIADSYSNAMSFLTGKRKGA